MSATSAPFGLRPAYHPSGLDRAQGLANIIESGYAQDLLKGQAVKLDTANTGYIVRAAGTDAIYGVFDGVEWTDTTGRRRVSNYWPANTAYQTGSLIAYIWTDPQVVYEIQANGSIAQTAIGQEFDITSPYAGSSTTGLSQSLMDTTAASVNTSRVLRVIDLAPYPGNAWGDAYTIVRVQIAKFQYNGTYDTGATAVVYPVTIKV
jgi:hypothetical protein